MDIFYHQNFLKSSIREAIIREKKIFCEIICEYFQEWIFRGEYFSGVNIFAGVNICQGRLVFKEEYFSRVIFLKG